MEFKYFNRTDVEYNINIPLPKAFVINKEFKDINSQSKILYGLMLDRMELSLKNDFVDEKGNVYIIYTLEEIMDNLNISIATASKRINELEKYGFIEKKAQGLNKPNLIYVKKVIFGKIVNEYLIKKRDNITKINDIKIDE